MRIDDIHLLYQYNDWANDRILTAADALTPAQLSAPNDFGWGNLLGTLCHLMEAQYVWRQILTQGALNEYLDEADYPDVASIRSFLLEERQAFWAYLHSLSDDDLSNTIEYETKFGKRSHVVWHCLWHLVNHGTQHRSECAALVTELGHSPGDLDFTHFISSR